MSQLNDLQYAALIAQGYTGALPDMLKEWESDNATFLANYSGTPNDKMYNVLLMYGYTGAIQDMFMSFWADGGYLSVASESFDTGIGDFTYTRTGTQFVEDHDGVLLPLDADEFGIEGGRRVKNFMLKSAAPDTWTQFVQWFSDNGGTGAAITEDGVPVWQITATGDNKGTYILNNNTVPPRLVPKSVYGLRFDIKEVSGGVAWADYHRPTDNQKSPTESGSGSFTPSSSNYQTMASAFDGAAEYFGHQVSIKTLSGTGAGVVNTKNFQFEDLTGAKQFIPNEYVPSSATEYGVQWFNTLPATTRASSAFLADVDELIKLKDPVNATSFVGVLTDVVGTVLPTVKGVVSEPASTNLSTVWNSPDERIGWAKASGAGGGVPFANGGTTVLYEQLSHMLTKADGDIALVNGAPDTITGTNLDQIGVYANDSIWIWRSNDDADGDLQGPFQVASVASGTITLTSSGALTSRAASGTVETRIFRCPSVSDNIMLELNNGTYHESTVSTVTLQSYAASPNWKLPVTLTIADVIPSDGGYAGSDNGRTLFYYKDETDFGLNITGTYTFKVVSDRANLIEAGLGYLVRTGLCYEITTTGASEVVFAGANGVTFEDYSASVWARSVLGNNYSFKIKDATGATTVSNSTWERVLLNGSIGFLTLPHEAYLGVPSGRQLRFVLNQLENHAGHTSGTEAQASSEIIVKRATATRGATLLTKDWNSDKVNNINGSLTFTAGWGDVDKEQVLWSVYEDVNNYIKLSLSNSVLTLEKNISGTLTTATQALVPVAGTSYDIEWFISSVDGMQITVDEVAGGTVSSLNDTNITPTSKHQIGSMNNTLHCVGKIKDVLIR